MVTLTADILQSLLGRRLSVDADGGVEMWRIDGVIGDASTQAPSSERFRVLLTAPPDSDRRGGLRRGVLPDGEAIDFIATVTSADAHGVCYEARFGDA
ncbi:MAG: hypothetical protein JSS05_03485 [Proteobacteria bacterium]|nr:hypothetical protein [Pseudomonadota bacterium]